MLNVISLVEAILEDPTAVLRKQVDKAKGELMAELKDEGVEYDERMERLDEVEHPKPGKEFIYETYNEFVLDNPWAKEASVRPKSVAREMFENWQSFEDYVKSYGLERSEAVLLRHLSEVYKVLAQTVPPAVKTEELEEAEAFLAEILRGVDSSLLDEWERLRESGLRAAGGAAAGRAPGGAVHPQPGGVHAVGAGRGVRFREGAVAGAMGGGAGEGRRGVDGRAAGGAMDGVCRESHGSIRLDPEARNAKHFRVDEIPGRRAWRVEQVLVDDGGAERLERGLRGRSRPLRRGDRRGDGVGRRGAGRRVNHQEAFRERRCLIPVTAFYEWSGPKGAKTTHRFTRPDGGWLWMAGLWEEDAGLGPCFSMITTEANVLVAPIHDRMPAVLEDAELPGYLGGAIRVFAPKAGTLEVAGAINPLTGKAGQQELF